MDNEELQKIIIERMRKIRLNKGLSQMEVCLRAKLSQSFFANIESGKKQPSLLTVLRIASALEVNPRDFFPEINKNDKESIKKEICELIESL